VINLIVANMKKTLLLVFVAGMLFGFMKGLGLAEDQRRRIRKALFELNELPRRVCI